MSAMRPAWTVTFLALWLFPGTGQATPQNVLLLTVDQLPAQHPGFANEDPPIAQTPTMDGLASDGVVFASHFVDATTCHPARSSMLTGRPPFCHRAVRNGARLPETETTLAEVLGTHGYATGAFGKVHTAAEGAWQGFDTVVDRNRWKRGMRRLGFDSPGDAVWWISQTFETGVNLLPDSLQFDPLVTDHALDFIRSSAGSPWFAYVSYKGPHPPWIPTPAGWSGVDIGDGVDPIPDADTWSTKPHFQQQKFTDFGFDGLTQRDSELHHLAFAAHVEMVDGQIARIMTYLAEADLLKDTIVIVTSDHGDMAGTLGVFNKTFGPYMTVSQVPFVIRHPATFSSSTRVDHFTQGSDLLPTICDMLSIPVPESSMGTSMVELASGAPPIHSEVFTVNESYPISRMVFDGRYAFVQNPGDLNELYDLDVDPGQEASVLEDPDYADVLTRLQATLTAWKESGCQP